MKAAAAQLTPSKHAGIAMLFTSRDGPTRAVKLLLHLRTSKRPVDYPKWPLPNLRAAASVREEAVTRVAFQENLTNAAKADKQK